MRLKKLYLILLTLSSILSYCQDDEYEKLLSYSDCKKQQNLSLEKRLSNYPFNKAKEIKIISFTNINIIRDSLIVETQDEIPKTNGKIDLSKVKEIETLTSSDIDELSDIFYNFGYKENPKIQVNIKCYEPRNAILFLNEKGEIFEYIEICFECKKTVESSKKISLGEMCNQKLEMIKQIFKKRNIKFGIIDEKQP